MLVARLHAQKFFTFHEETEYDLYRKAFLEYQRNLDFRLHSDYTDEIGVMSGHFNQFMVRLKELMAEIKSQNWMKTAQNELNELLREQQDLSDMSNSILTFLCTYMKAPIGALYLSNEDQSLNMVATYAFTNRKGMAQHVQLGEGLIGQSALDKKPYVIADIPVDYLAVQSGLGEAAPKSVIVLPCVYEGEVKCVIELGSLETFTPQAVQLLESLADFIAITMYSTEVRMRMKELLDKTIQQSEELQMQQEELR